MADDTVQGTSPLITEPEVLSPEALKPASADDILASLSKITSEPAKPAATRRRGRPPGSKNRTAAERLADTNPEAAKALDAEKAREAKKARAEAIEKQIYGELNDSIMTLLIGAMNISPDAIYLPGKGPVVKPKDERFTELGNRLAIPQNLAHSIGRLASELEQTGVGQSVSGLAQNNNVGLIVAGGMTIFGIFQYAKTLNDTFEKLKILNEARQRAQQAASETITDHVMANSGSVS